MPRASMEEYSLQAKGATDPSYFLSTHARKPASSKLLEMSAIGKRKTPYQRQQMVVFRPSSPARGGGWPKARRRGISLSIGRHPSTTSWSPSPCRGGFYSRIWSVAAPSLSYSRPFCSTCFDGTPRPFPPPLPPPTRHCRVAVLSLSPRCRVAGAATAPDRRAAIPPHRPGANPPEAAPP